MVPADKSGADAESVFTVVGEKERHVAFAGAEGVEGVRPINVVDKQRSIGCELARGEREFALEELERVLAVVDVEIELAFEGGDHIEAAAFDELPRAFQLFRDEEASTDVGCIEFGVADAGVACGGGGFGAGEVDGDKRAFAVIVEAFEEKDGVAAIIDAGFEDAGGTERADKDV
ncbi:MAG TPA: hypothetical protein VFB63_12720 [Bryobacteraceae bacterium]|nr:hypothetical protein [Bryobacteraceae bacterium]